MKTKLLFGVLAAFIVGMLVIVAMMSSFLFDLSVEKPDKKTPFTAIQPEPAPETTPDAVTSQETPKVDDKSAPIVIDAAKTGKNVPKPKPPRKQIRIPEPGPAQTPRAEVTNAVSSEAKVTLLIGTATAIDGDSRSRILKINDPVSTDYTIETMASSRLEITFADGTNIKLGDSCRISIEDYLMDQTTPENSKFGMKVLKGSCRIITGMITKLNPSRFKVKTRMATVGIRGCDVSVRSQAKKESIYTLELSGPERVIINTSSDGRSLMDKASGKPITLPADASREILVHNSLTLVTLEEGQPPKEASMTSDDVNNVISETMALEPAKFEMIPTQGGVTFVFDNNKDNQQGETAK